MSASSVTIDSKEYNTMKSIFPPGYYGARNHLNPNLNAELSLLRDVGKHKVSSITKPLAQLASQASSAYVNTKIIHELGPDGPRWIQQDFPTAVASLVEALKQAKPTISKLVGHLKK